MGRKYPQYRCESAKAEAGHVCGACDRPATHTVRIAWSYMRGEDEWVFVCKRHFKMIENEEGRFFAHQATKERFLKSKADRS